MIKFKEYFLSEGKRFRNDKFYHLMDVPMFSIYIESHLMNNDEYSNNIFKNINALKKVFTEARNRIHDIGFPSQHVNVLFSEMREYDKKYAHYNPKNRNITINYEVVLKELNSHLTNILVHEWAHAWMFNRGGKFREEILKIYRNKRRQYKPNNETNKIIKFDSVSFINDMSNTMNKYKNNSSLMDVILRTKLKNISYKTLHLLPHNTSVSTTLSKEEFFDNYQNKTIKVPKDSPVTVVKLHNNYSIDYFHNGSRYYLDAYSVKDILESVNETSSSLLIKFKKALMTINVKSNLDYFKENLQRDIQTRFIDHIRKSYNNTSLKIKITDNAWDMAQKVSHEIVNMYVIPELIKDIKSLSLDEIVENLKNCYNWFWVMNSFKNSSNSYLESFYRRVLNECEHFHDINYDLSGDDKRLQRYIFQLAEIWYDQYGMSNEDELWATAIDGFFKLPDRDRKVIINLINNS